MDGRLACCAVIGISVILCTLAGFGLARLGVDDPEFALLPAVVAAWLIDGVVGGLITIAVAAIVAWFFFTPPVWTFQLPNFGDAMAFLLYIVVTAFVCVVVRAQKNRIDALLEDNRTLNRKLFDADIRYDKNARGTAPR